MQRGFWRAALPVLFVIVGACGSDDGTNGARATTCPSLAEHVHADASGQRLAAAFRAHVPTQEEIKYAGFWLTVASQLKDTGTIEPTLRAKIRTAATDPAQDALFGKNLGALYAAVLPPCATDTTKQGVISQPFQCSDDCRITLDQLIGFLGIPSVVVGQLGGGLLGNALTAIPYATGDQSLTQVVNQYMDGNLAYDLATKAGAQIATAAEINGAALALTGQAVPAALLESLAGFLTLGTLGLKVLALARLIDDCKAFKLEPANECDPSVFVGESVITDFYGAQLKAKFRVEAGAPAQYTLDRELQGTISLSWLGISETGTTTSFCDGKEVTCPTSKKAAPLDVTVPASGQLRYRPASTDGAEAYWEFYLDDEAWPPGPHITGKRDCPCEQASLSVETDTDLSLISTTCTRGKRLTNWKYDESVAHHACHIAPEN